MQPEEEWGEHGPLWSPCAADLHLSFTSGASRSGLVVGERGLEVDASRDEEERLWVLGLGLGHGC